MRAPQSAAICGERSHLFEYGIGDRFRRQVHLHAAEIGAIGIAGMRADRQLPAQRLLDGRLHGSLRRRHGRRRRC